MGNFVGLGDGLGFCCVSVVDGGYFSAVVDLQAGNVDFLSEACADDGDVNGICHALSEGELKTEAIVQQGRAYLGG